MAVTEGRGLVLDSIFFSVRGLRILQGVYLRLDPATVCVLFGRNGCGKTTLLKVAAAQHRPDSGILIIDGVRYHKPAKQERFQRISYLPQQSMLPGDQRVRQLLAALPSGEALLEDDLIGNLSGRYIDELSGGERRYLEIRLVLALDRDYALLDEPFTGLEPKLIDRISQLIVSEARQGKGVLVTDHYHHYTIPLADDAYIMNNKQCRHLDGGDIKDQLVEMGYIRGNQTNDPTPPPNHEE